MSYYANRSKHLRRGFLAAILVLSAVSLPSSSSHSTVFNWSPVSLQSRNATSPLLQVQAADPGFLQVTDLATGVQVSLPLALVNGPSKVKWGNNWRASDNRLNIDTMNFRGERTLAAVHHKLLTINGRKISNDSFDGSQFVLQGSDSDGTLFLVQCAEMRGEVRGISVVYSKWARTQLEPVVATIVHSLELFPTPSAPPQYVPPPSTQLELPATPQIPPELASNSEIKKLQEKLEALQSQIKAQEEDAKRRDDEQRQQTREDEIRRQEREKAQEEARKVEERLIAEIDRRFTEQKRTTLPGSASDAKIKIPEIGPLPPGRRVAFVVGIDVYRDLSPQYQLRRAVGDARLMRSTLERLGFEVLPVSENISRREFAQLWQRYLQKIEPGSTTAFFFAGHGVQMQGVNYLLPSDIPVLRDDSAELLQLEALNFNHLYADVLARKPKISFLILDACRDNPFAHLGRSLGGRRGLTTVKPIEGSFVLYSANADEQALDGLPGDPPEETNSVFTRTLAPLLLESNVTLQEVARNVRKKVAELAAQVGHKQWPSYYDGLTGNVCLAGTCGLEAAEDPVHGAARVKKQR